MKLNVRELNEVSNEIRKDIVTMLHESGSGHPGGSLSSADVLAALYFNVMNIDPENPKKEGRDKFVLSKGHAAPVLYAALARRGYFDPSELLKLRKMGAMLQGHPDMKGTPGVEMSTGSLGQGFSTAVGMAIAGKLDKKSDRVFALLGDGEMNEGLVWEAMMSAAHYKLDNLVAIVDHNGLQIDGPNAHVMGLDPLKEKWESFGWNAIDVDGHDIEALLAAFEAADKTENKPTVLIAKTIKGKGVSYMEDLAGWHGKAPSSEELQIALKDLGGDNYEY